MSIWGSSTWNSLRTTALLHDTSLSVWPLEQPAYPRQLQCLCLAQPGPEPAAMMAVWRRHYLGAKGGGLARQDQSIFSTSILKLNFILWEFCHNQPCGSLDKRLIFFLGATEVQQQPDVTSNRKFKWVIAAFIYSEIYILNYVWIIFLNGIQILQGDWSTLHREPTY